MSHKTLISGVTYEITDGKGVVGNTSYDIASGKTLIGGTGYDIQFGWDGIIYDGGKRTYGGEFISKTTGSGGYDPFVTDGYITLIGNWKAVTPAYATQWGSGFSIALDLTNYSSLHIISYKDNTHCDGKLVPSTAPMSDMSDACFEPVFSTAISSWGGQYSLDAKEGEKNAFEKVIDISGKDGLRHLVFWPYLTSMVGTIHIYISKIWLT